MTTDPAREPNSAVRSAQKATSVQRTSVLDDSGPQTAEPASPSLVRWALVVVPVLVILLATSNLVGVWSLPGQQRSPIGSIGYQLPSLDGAIDDFWSDFKDAAGLDPVDTPPHSEPQAPRPMTVDELWREIQGEAQQRRPAPSPQLPAPAETPPPQEPQSSADVERQFEELRRMFDRPESQPADQPAVEQELSALEPNAERGARTFKMCQACHTVEKAEPSRIGPNLWGVIGRPVASEPGYLYSEALSTKGGVWSEAELARYLENPRAAVPGTKMAFAGIRDPQRIADLIAYLESAGR